MKIIAKYFSQNNAKLQMCTITSSDGKESACSAEDPGSIPRSGKFPAGGNGNPLQYCCLENPIPWTEEPGGLNSMGLQRVRPD